MVNEYDDYSGFDDCQFEEPLRLPPPQGDKTQTNSPEARWTAPYHDVKEMLGHLTANDGNHDYNQAVGVSTKNGFIYEGPAIDGVDCKGCYCEVLTSSYHLPVAIGIIVKIRNESTGQFEDFIPGGMPVASHFTILGAPTARVVVVADMPSAMVIHDATKDCVVVAHYQQNLPDVLRTVCDQCSDAEVVFATGSSRPSDVVAIKRLLASSNGFENFQVAKPSSETTFHALLKKGGNLRLSRQAVRTALNDASGMPSIWNAEKEEQDYPHVICWPAPVHAAGLLAGICAYLGKHTALRFTSICAIALWIMATHFSAKARIATILSLISLTKGCGKTTTLGAIAALVPRPDPVSDITPAGLYESCSANATLLIDECDETLRRSNSPLVRYINAGYTRVASKVARKVGNKRTRFDTFGFKLIAAIGELPHQIMDRSIVIPTIRKHMHEHVVPYEPSDNDEATVLRAQLEIFALDNAERIATLSPEMPDLSRDRALDNWRLLITLASLGGPVWLANAGEAALALTQAEDEVPTIMEELIRDLAQIYRDSDDGFPTSGQLQAELCNDKTKPWTTYSDGRPIDFHDLAKLMKKLKLSPEQKNRDGHNLKGYRLERLKDLFDRYCPQKSGDQA